MYLLNFNEVQSFFKIYIKNKTEQQNTKKVCVLFNYIL